MSFLYVLNDADESVPESDWYRWATWFEGNRQRRVAGDEVGEWYISTVFLAIDHALLGGAPILWETMVFGPEPWGGWQDRYTSRADAEAGHKRVVELVRCAPSSEARSSSSAGINPLTQKMRPAHPLQGRQAY